MFYFHLRVRIVLDPHTKMIRKDEMEENGWMFLKWKKVSYFFVKKSISNQF